MTDFSTQAQRIVDSFYFTFADKRVDFTVQKLNNNALANVLRELALVCKRDKLILLSLADELENL